jgi:hypothetical protein
MSQQVQCVLGSQLLLLLLLVVVQWLLLLVVAQWLLVLPALWSQS